MVFQSVAFSIVIFASGLANLAKGEDVRICYEESTEVFRVNGTCSDPVAFATFDNDLAATGWTKLEVITSNHYDNAVQAYAAGVAEGLLTKTLISQNWNNVVAGYCNGATNYCARLKNYLIENLKWINGQILENPQDPYWQQVELLLIQLAGLEDGYFNIVQGPHTDISPFGFFLLQIAGPDTADLENALGGRNEIDKHKQRNVHCWPVPPAGRCSAFVKPINDFQDLVFSHVTWAPYSTMLRVQKLYNLGYTYGGQKRLPGAVVTMSSYPGVLWSIDDFYTTSMGLAIQETSISNGNQTLYDDYVRPDGTLLTWMRVNIANRLSTTAKAWADYMKTYNSGTYNNQWMIVDYKRFNPGLPLQNGTFHVLELMPGLTHDEDMSLFLNEQGYWPSYNVPYFKDIYEESEQTTPYDTYFRALMFKRQWQDVNNMTSLQNLMRYNDYRHDPLARVNNTPPYDACIAISARYDLNPSSWDDHEAFGGLDFKATNLDLVKKLQFVSISGPTWESVEPFVWSNSDLASKVAHEGQPDSFKFDPVTYEWKFFSRQFPDV